MTSGRQGKAFLIFFGKSEYVRRYLRSFCIAVVRSCLGNLLLCRTLCDIGLGACVRACMLLEWKGFKGVIFFSGR